LLIGRFDHLLKDLNLGIFVLNLSFHILESGLSQLAQLNFRLQKFLAILVG
jgi:hypothetical protein